jgi:hypothetical protein
MSGVWITVVKVALLAYLTIAVAAIIVVRRRRMRASWDEYLHVEPQPFRHHPPQPARLRSYDPRRRPAHTTTRLDVRRRGARAAHWSMRVMTP